MITVVPLIYIYTWYTYSVYIHIITYIIIYILIYTVYQWQVGQHI